MNMMKAIQIPAKGEKMMIVQIPVPQPGEGQVLLRVEACGVCHGDSVAIKGAATAHPRIPGHEVVGRVAQLGSGTTKWNLGDRVGVGWHAGGNEVTGLTIDGGYAEYMVEYEDSLISIPGELSSMEAAPLMCAGETTFSALRNSKARPGDLVAVQGIGSGLGAHHYIDSEKEDSASVLQELGGAKVILATAPHAKAISSLIKGLGTDSELLIVAGSGEQLGLSASDFLKGPNTVRGSFTGYAKDIQKAVHFSVLTDVRPVIESFPLEYASEAYDKMMAATTRFRAVLRICEIN